MLSEQGLFCAVAPDYPMKAGAENYITAGKTKNAGGGQISAGNRCSRGGFSMLHFFCKRNQI
ncbi:hypothetical protein C173_03604 [Paenibacillus sp. FSL R7-277]|nr:hypothetical protein C173_03604 [Paenibacillus sp. FSL R7-277]